MFITAEPGDADLLNEILTHMNVSESSSASEAQTAPHLQKCRCCKDEITMEILITANLVPSVSLLCLPWRQGRQRRETLVRGWITAARYENLDCVKIVLRNIADIESRGQDCRLRHICTALFVAAKKGHVDILSCLVENGADVNALYNDLAPLMIASRKGRANAVTFLAEHGAGIDLQDKKGETALHYAVRCDSPEVAQKLLTFGASQLKNNRGLTPVLSASNECNISVLNGLINRQQCTKEQRIDALELPGSSFLFSDYAKYKYVVNEDVDTRIRTTCDQALFSSFRRDGRNEK